MTARAPIPTTTFPMNPMNTTNLTWMTLLLLAAGCQQPVRDAATTPADAAIATAGAETGEAGEDLESPSERMRWRALRYQDESGRIDPQGHVNALAERQAALAAVPETAGISRTQWYEFGPRNIAGRSRCLWINPGNSNHLIAGGVAGGLWRSTSAGSTWEPIGDFMGNQAFSCLAGAPTVPGTLYAGTGEGYGNVGARPGAGIWKSTDSGATWTRLLATAAWPYINRISVSPANPSWVLAATNGGIYRSSDAGTTWSQVYTAVSYQVGFCPNDGTRVMAAVNPGGGRILTSNDAGLTWTVRAPAFAGRVEFAWTNFPAGTAYLVADNTTSANVWRSTDYGFTWTQRNTTPVPGQQWWFDAAVWIDPTDSNSVLVGGQWILRSTDGGATFTSISISGANTEQPHADIHQFVAAPGFGATNRTLYVCTDGGVYVTQNPSTASTTGGWSRRDTEMRTTQFYGVAGHGQTFRISGGAQDNNWLTITPFTTTAVETAQGDGGYVAMDPTDDNYIYGETQLMRVRRSTDGGATSTVINAAIPGVGTSGISNFIAPLVLDPNDNRRLYVGGMDLWRTNDARAATPIWTSARPAATQPISAIAIAPGNANLVWLGYNNGQVWKTTNGTAATPTWTAVDDNGATNPLPNRYVTRILIDRTDHNRVFVAFGGYLDGLYRTQDGGNTFGLAVGTAPTKIPAVPVHGIAQHPALADHFYVGTDVGVWASADRGATWSTQNDGPSDAPVDEVVFMHHSNRLLAGTYGRGIFMAEVFEPEVNVLGAGCPGPFGQPQLGTGRPIIGQNFAVTGNGPPGGIGWLAIGYSSNTWFGNPLPFHLDVFGANGCYLRVALDRLADVTFDGSGSFVRSIPIANDRAVLGTEFFLQYFAEVPGFNAFGKVASSALRVQIGA